jgi:hypothetical protein
MAIGSEKRKIITFQQFQVSRGDEGDSACQSLPEPPLVKRLCDSATLWSMKKNASDDFHERKW